MRSIDVGGFGKYFDQGGAGCKHVATTDFVNSPVFPNTLRSKHLLKLLHIAKNIEPSVEKKDKHFYIPTWNNFINAYLQEAIVAHRVARDLWCFLPASCHAFHLFIEQTNLKADYLICLNNLFKREF